ncbi:MAG: hypothetical protein FJ253_00580 [Phycisphaerae bacterium]|nr:hypothetical protein [Phycisphaerae bacterium]
MGADVGWAIGLGVLLLAVLTLFGEIGFRIGRWQAASGAAALAGQIGAIQGALLGLLGLLLGFSFAAAGSRFLERQDLIVEEANALGTAYLRADLLPAERRTELQSALRDYLGARLEITARLRMGMTDDDHRLVSAQQARIWRAAVDGVNDRPDSIVVVLGPVNEVIDLHATRLAAGRKHLPPTIMGLLIACSMLALGVIGYGCGVGKSRRMLLTMSVAFVVAAALWTTIDLDYPRMGLLRLNDGPLKALHQDMTRP